MENNQLHEQTFLGTFMFEEKLDNQDGNSFLEAIPQRFITKYATLDEALKHIKTFYMFMEDYCYNIVIPAKKGHKLLVRKSQDKSQMLEVYSLNYQEVITAQNNSVKRNHR